MAPAYANLFMGNLEPILQRLGHNHIKLWTRFIDDIFIVWTGLKEELIEFMKKINKIHPTFHFTFDLSESEVTFTDVTLFKGNRFKSEHILDIYKNPHQIHEQPWAVIGLSLMTAVGSTINAMCLSTTSWTPNSFCDDFCGLFMWSST